MTVRKSISYSWQKWPTVEPNHALSTVFGPRDVYLIEIFNDIYCKRYNIPKDEIVDHVLSKARKDNVKDDVSFQYKRDGNIKKIILNYYYSQIAIERYCIADNPSILDFACGINVAKSIMQNRHPEWQIDACDIRNREWFLNEYAWDSDYIECNPVGSEDFLDDFRKQYDVILLSRASYLTECTCEEFQLWLQKISFLLKENGIFVITQPGMFGSSFKINVLFDRSLNTINYEEYKEKVLPDNKPFCLVTKSFADLELAFPGIDHIINI